MIKVSIIIPVYNTEKYLHECLDSVIAQKLREIEIICVNDGSTDNCSQILDDYAKRDSRIVVINERNSGSIAARKAGISVARGEYIGFVDSDDWIEQTMYEKLYLLAVENNVDLVTSGYYREGNYTTVQLDNIKEGVYYKDKIEKFRSKIIYNMEEKALGISGSMCCKLYKTDILKRIQEEVPDSLIFSEDKMCNLLFALNCTSVYVLKEAYYHYRMQPSSVVHTSRMNYLIYVNEVYQFLIKLYQHPNFLHNMRVQAELYITELLIHGINQRMGFENRNLLWIDPYWLDYIPNGACVALYGGGELGEKYKCQMSVRPDLTYAGCFDYEFEKYYTSEQMVKSPLELERMSYDYVVITIRNPQKAKEMKKYLIKDNICAEKILWFEQKDIFWKYAEANGLLGLGECGNDT